MLSPVQKIRASLRHKGIRETSDLIVKNVRYLLRTYVTRAPLHLDHNFDLRFGTDTSAVVELNQLEIESENREHGVRYSPTYEKRFREIVNTMPIKHEEFVFIDFGSGKGKALLLASDFPFKRIVGVEFSPDLHRIAEHNFRIYRSPTQRCMRLESVCIDASLFILPDEPCVLYFNNPFDQHVMACTLQNIEASMSRHPRPMFIIYVNPLWNSLFEEANWLEKVAASDHWSVYSTRQASLSSQAMLKAR